jgi:hypothetical protein
MVSPCHSLSPSPFQKSLTPPPHPSNSPRSSGHLHLHCRPPQRRSPVGTPPLKLAFTTSPVLRHLVVSPPPTLPGALATRDQCSFRRPCTALGMGRPGRLCRWAKPSLQGHGPDSGPVLWIAFHFLKSISDLNFHKFIQDSKIHRK